jgi:hypothetical protein
MRKELCFNGLTGKSSSSQAAVQASDGRPEGLRLSSGLPCIERVDIEFPEPYEHQCAGKDDERRKEEGVRSLEVPAPRIDDRAPHGEQRYAGDDDQNGIQILPEQSEDDERAERHLRHAKRL